MSIDWVDLICIFLMVFHLFLGKLGQFHLNGFEKRRQERVRGREMDYKRELKKSL
jgi:hypothetical protein